MKHIEDAEAGDVTLKINRQGVVTDSAVVLERAEEVSAELESAEASPVAGREAAVPDAPAPPRPPRVPPRRAPQPAREA